MKYKYNIKNLDCANCAKKIENRLNEDKQITKATVNFATSKLTVETSLTNPLPYITKIVKKIEPDVILTKEYQEEKSNNKIIKLILGLILGLIGLLLPMPSYLSLIIIILAYIILIWDTLSIALKQLKNKQINENFLVSISTIGAYLLGETKEGLMVIFLYQLGKILESLAVNKSRSSVANLMNIKEEQTNLKDGNKIKQIPTELVNIGDIIVVKKGEKIPLDGIITKGNATLDTSAITGESSPLYVEKGDNVLSGTINKHGLLEIKVTSIYEDSTVSKILDLVETATDKKSKTETVVSKYSTYYTLLVVIIALLVAVFLPLFTSFTYQESIYKALTILVISCPCAIAISIPLSYFSGIGKSSKEGILVKGSNYLDSIKNIKEIIFDKTGTITTGNFYVSKVDIFNDKYTEEQVLELFAKGESLSNHPIAKSILNKYNKEISTKNIKNYKEISGMGISYEEKDKKVKIGNSKFCNLKENTNNIYLTINNKLISSLEIEDEIKPNAKETIEELQSLGINVHMFTGDNKEKALSLANKLNIKDVRYQMLPEDKYKELEKIIKEKQPNTIVSFVGDGINDAPVLALSDLGISMGSLGTDSAIEASDVVITNDNLDKIVTAIKISKKTNKIIKENLFFAIFIKFSILILTMIGLSTMWEAVFADVGVTVICILNTLRLLKK